MKSQRDVYIKVKDFHSRLTDDKHHRYLSWEHCYDYFGQDEVDPDKACLHMAFYLASWGMYRGSAFLLQKDYLIHKEVVSHLLTKRHLRKINADNFSAHIDEIVKLCRWIKDWYEDRRNVGIINGDEQRKSNGTDTLVTKVVLRALGCVPAYDRYFIDGLRNHPLVPSAQLKPSKNGIEALVNFLNNHKDQFAKLQENVKTKNGMPYPVMKLVDMYFWQIGSEQNRKVKATQ